ncbi:hypothetical protein Golob_024684 [Gossypium lobatum]|uniref:Uncharacterized protein n=1 Tax=Gossypium lobatum TaxID=34289 RepID=A0A7J8NG37_9ROSI|nr:hypothetical protein [Gossypium lobatum]
MLQVPTFKLSSLGSPQMAVDSLSLPCLLVVSSLVALKPSSLPTSMAR